MDDDSLMESYSNEEDDNFSDATYEASTEEEELSDSLPLDLEDEDFVSLPEYMRPHYGNDVDNDVGETLVEGDDDDLNIDEDNEGTQHVEKGKVYPIHDPNMNWKDTRPFLGDRLRASWMQTEKFFQIKSLNDNHNCSRNYSLGSLVTASWIAKMYLRELIARPFVRIRDMQADILRDYMVKVSRGQCCRAKSMAMFEIEGGLKEHYVRIWDYAHEILRSNPGSSVKVGVNGMPDGSNVFSRIYICFKALKEGWVACRKVIDLDGTFLKGLCKGELLTTTGRDANNQIYPIAWAVVKVENKENWKWFIECLKDDIGISDGRDLTIISYI
ncbi:uncharacterized protein LOC110919962 [Helianthus annuus]|uniref:uncharacterized protein LOC110919962 n=1 Tax=Helianthus annuus TaxID=4232 RepID=UPI000B9063F8|nr:uncharacterized protein LOC110919962 [Helianthus annuus]